MISMLIFRTLELDIRANDVTYRYNYMDKLYVSMKHKIYYFILGSGINVYQKWIKVIFSRRIDIDIFTSD